MRIYRLFKTFIFKRGDTEYKVPLVLTGKKTPRLLLPWDYSVVPEETKRWAERWLEKVGIEVTTGWVLRLHTLELIGLLSKKERKSAYQQWEAGTRQQLERQIKLLENLINKINESKIYIPEVHALDVGLRQRKTSLFNMKNRAERAGKHKIFKIMIFPLIYKLETVSSPTGLSLLQQLKDLTKLFKSEYEIDEKQLIKDYRANPYKPPETIPTQSPDEGAKFAADMVALGMGKILSASESEEIIFTAPRSSRGEK